MHQLCRQLLFLQLGNTRKKGGRKLNFVLSKSKKNVKSIPQANNPLHNPSTTPSHRLFLPPVELFRSRPIARSCCRFRCSRWHVSRSQTQRQQQQAGRSVICPRSSDGLPCGCDPHDHRVHCSQGIVRDRLGAVSVCVFSKRLKEGG